MHRYLFFNKIENETPLAQLLNAVMEKAELVRHIVAPSSTTVVAGIFDGFERQTAQRESANMFYKLCFTEVYFHQIIRNLLDWNFAAEKYNVEFACSWKYYAISRHMELVTEYGGEDEDYNEDGSVKTDLDNKAMKSCTIVGEMIDHNDIYLTTGKHCLHDIYNILLKDSEFSLQKIFNQLGSPLKTYRQGENGEMIENSWADEQLMGAKQQHVCDSLVDMMYSAQHAVVDLVKDVKKLKPFTDNRPFFQKLPGRIEAILQLQIPIIEYPLKGGSNV